MKTRIKLSHAEPGFHCWETAPVEEMFLRNRHRHLFFFYLTFKVNATKGVKRQKEFFVYRLKLLNFLEGYYGHSIHGLEFGERSCEMIAMEIFDHFKGDGIQEVEVSEDKENSSIVIE